MIVHFSVARPHIKFPAQKNALAHIKPFLRPNISVSLPDNGCRAALAMRYPDASHENRENDLKVAVMGADMVAIIVVSASVSL